MYTSTNDAGETVSFVESQIVARILEEYTSLTQVMIGEAICVQELMKLLAASANDLVKEAQLDLRSEGSLVKLNYAKSIAEHHFPAETTFLENIKSLIELAQNPVS